MKKLLISSVIAVVFSAGFVTANVVGFNNVASAANQIWKKVGNAIFPDDVNTANVGIGTKTPSERLTVAGKIESTNGGFKFPDGTVQASAGDKNLHLYDANGQDLGVFLASGVPGGYYNSLSDYQTYVSQSNIIAIVENDGQSNQSLYIKKSNNTSIYFTGANCTGTPFFDVSNAHSFFRLDPLILFKGGYQSATTTGRYFRATSDYPSAFSSLSSLDYASCNPSINSFSSAIDLQEITLPFTEPLAWPLSIR